MTRRGTRRPPAGTIVQIALPDGRFAYGRLLNGAMIGVYPAIAREPGMPPVGDRNYLFVVGIYDHALRSDRVRAMGIDIARDPEEDWGPPMYVRDVISGGYEIYHKGQMRPSTEEECRGLEQAAVWELDGIITRIMTAPHQSDRAARSDDPRRPSDPPGDTQRIPNASARSRPSEMEFETDASVGATPGRGKTMVHGDSIQQGDGAGLDGDEGEDHAVFIQLRLPQNPPHLTADIEELFAFEDALTSAIEQAGVGELEGDEVGEKTAVIFTYGPDANRLADAIMPILRASQFAAGSRVVKRYGGPGAREVIISQ